MCYLSGVHRHRAKGGRLQCHSWAQEVMLAPVTVPHEVQTGLHPAPDTGQKSLGHGGETRWGQEFKLP